MRGKHLKTLQAIYERPIRADIRAADVVSLIEAAGGAMKQGSGSRISATLNGVRLRLHMPHPRPEMDKGAVKDLRRFLEEAGVRP